MYQEVQFPVKIRVSDYHEFDPLARFLQKLFRVNIGYTEIDEGKPYVAVFHVGAYNPDDVENRTLPEITFE